MTDVQGLGHIGAAVVDDNGFALPGLFHAEIRCGAHLFQIPPQEIVAELQVQKAGHHGVDHGKIGGVQLLCHSLSNLNGGAFVLFGSSQRAVALVFAQVGTVGNRDPAEGRIIPCLFKGRLHFGGDDV